MARTLGDRITMGLGVLVQVAWPFASAAIAYVTAEQLWARGLIMMGVWVVGGAILWFLLAPVFAVIGSMFDR